MKLRTLLLCGLPLSALCGIACGAGAFLLSPFVFPPETTYAGLQGFYIFWSPGWHDPLNADRRPPRKPMPPEIQAALRAVLEDPNFLTDVKDVRHVPGGFKTMGPITLRHLFPGGNSDPPPRNWISSKASLEFDPFDSEICYLVVRGPDAIGAGVGALTVGHEFLVHTDRAIARMVGPPPRGMHSRAWLKGDPEYRTEVDDRLPERQRLALWAGALAAAGVVVAVAARDVIRRRRQRAMSALPESLVSHPASPAPAEVGLQDFPPPRPSA